MEKYIIDKKSWQNLAAFIEVNSETNEVTVRGKIYGCGDCSAAEPETNVLGTIPPHLFEQAKELVESGQRLFWLPIPEKEECAELQDFLNDIYAKAKAENSWFSY